jgi:hypothetical protein
MKSSHDHVFRKTDSFNSGRASPNPLEKNDHQPSNLQPNIVKPKSKKAAKAEELLTMKERMFQLVPQFRKLQPADRHLFLLCLLGECDQRDMAYLNNVLPNLHRNFLALLPPKLAFNILVFLPPETLLDVSLVSKKWHKLLSTSDLWTDFYARLHIPLHENINFWDGLITKNAVKYQLFINWTHKKYKAVKIPLHSMAIMACLLKFPLVFTGSADHTIRIFNIVDNTDVALLKGHEDDISCLQFTNRHKVRVNSLDYLVD